MEPEKDNSRAERKEERYMEIYRLLRQADVSDDDIGEFAGRYYREGGPTKRAHRKELEEARKEQQEARDEAIKTLAMNVKVLSDEDLDRYSRKYFPEDHEVITDNNARIGRQNPFLLEQMARIEQRRNGIDELEVIEEDDDK